MNRPGALFPRQTAPRAREGRTDFLDHVVSRFSSCYPTGFAAAQQLYFYRIGGISEGRFAPRHVARRRQHGSVSPLLPSPG
jgi:hypothetical protein